MVCSAGWTTWGDKKKVSSLTFPSIAYNHSPFRPFIIAGLDKPAFPMIVECLSFAEAETVLSLQSIVARIVKQQLSGQELASTICGHPAFKEAFPDVFEFYAVVIGAPGIYRTRSGLHVQLCRKLTLHVTSANARAAVSKFEHPRWFFASSFVEAVEYMISKGNSLPEADGVEASEHFPNFVATPPSMLQLLLFI
jgi:hypothetical protein